MVYEFMNKEEDAPEPIELADHQLLEEINNSMKSIRRYVAIIFWVWLIELLLSLASL